MTGILPYFRPFACLDFAIHYSRPLREFLRQHAKIEQVIDFAGLPVFLGATVRTIVLLSEHRQAGDYRFLYSPPMPADAFSVVAAGSVSVDQAIQGLTYDIDQSVLTQTVWSFVKQQDDDLLTRLRMSFTPLVQYCEGKICMGVKSGLTEAFVIDEETRQSIVGSNPDAAEIIKPFVNGRDVRRYFVDYQNRYLLYTFHGVPIGKYPSVEKHLRPFKDALLKRATRQAWYELQQPQLRFAPLLEGPKIIFPDIATAPRFAHDETGYFGANTIYFIPRRDLYLLGLLNSRLGHFYFVRTCAGLEGKNDVYLRFFGQYLEGFPIRPIDFTSPTDVARHDQMVALVERILDLHKRLAAEQMPHVKTVLQRQIEATDRQIDLLVYELYGLTDEEIGVVEDRAAR